MGCCLSRNKTDNGHQEVEEKEILPNSDIRRFIKEKETVIEGPQTVVPSRRNNNSVMEDNMPESNPYMEESFRNYNKNLNRSKNNTSLNVSRDNFNNSSILEGNDEQKENNDNNNFNLLNRSLNESRFSNKKESKNKAIIDNTIVFKIVNFELTFPDFFQLFRCKLQPTLTIYFEDLWLELEYTSGNGDFDESIISVSKNIASVTSNKGKFKKFGFDDKKFSIKLCNVLNDNSFIIFNISHKKYIVSEKEHAFIAEGNLPLNLLVYSIIAGDNNSIISIPMINIVENIVIGQLTVELSCNFESYYEEINQNILENQKYKLDDYLNTRILKYVDIDKNLRNSYFKLDKQKLKSFVEEDNSDINCFIKLKNLLLTGKFNEIKDVLEIGEKICNERNFYNLLYILNEMIENGDYKKINPTYFSENYLYKFFENNNEEMKNLLVFDNQLKFFINVIEKNLMTIEFKYQLINIVNIMNCIKKDIYPFILNSILNNNENLEKKKEKIKKNETFVNFSDPELICLKNILYQVLHLIRIILKAEIEIEKFDKKSKIYDLNLKIIEKDISFFRTIFKDVFLIQNEYLLKDCNITFGITKCFLTYFKLVKKFCVKKNLSKTSLILETYLNENSEFLVWLLKVFCIHLTNKKFYLDFLEISNDLLEDAFGVFLINYLNIFNVKLIIRSFLQYHTKISSESLKIWYYYLSILSKISGLIRRVRDNHIDSFTLSNSDQITLMTEMINILNFFENNQYLMIKTDINENVTDENNGVKDSKFFEKPLCIQMQIKSLELLKNLSRNEYFMKCYLIENDSLIKNSEGIKKIFFRIIYLLFLDTKTIKQEFMLKLYHNILLNIIYIFYYLINEIEIYSIFFKTTLPSLIDIDLENIICKLIELIEKLKEINKDNSKQYLRLEYISNDFQRIITLNDR